LLKENPAGIFLLRDELTGFLAGLERPERETDRSFYLECWAGDSPFTMDRIARGCVRAEHCCVSIFGGIQPARLRSYLADALRDGPKNDGLMQRFQLLVWPDMNPGWIYRDIRPNANAIKSADTMYRRITGINPESPLLFKFDPDAQELFVAWLTILETGCLRSADVNPILQAHLAKYRSLMPSLALLLSLADGATKVVDFAHAQQAADWCEYLQYHAIRVYSSTTSPQKMAALNLSRKLLMGWKKGERETTVRDVYRNDWIGLSTPNEARAALQMLADAGWVRLVPQAAGSGRPSEVYAINPRISDMSGVS
jgi:hypothetical protein